MSASMQLAQYFWLALKSFLHKEYATSHSRLHGHLCLQSRRVKDQLPLIALRFAIPKNMELRGGKI